ncbi:MAG: LysM peptidoglycan-binding domain-containing protein [Chloroflexota bacterium]
MTERALPGMDGAPACPFVAFGDDREARSTSPDHRHRCFAESPPAPRALAHQEAYCLSSAFPVCPTFQDWARREAAHARAANEQSATPAASTPAPAAPDPEPTSPPRVYDLYADWSVPAPDPAPSDVEAGLHETPPDGDEPIERNPPRDWAAPPPWATGAAAAAALSGQAAAPGTPSGGSSTPGQPPTQGPVEGQGLAGSPADRLAAGEVPAAVAWSASGGGHASTAPDDELAGLVQPRPSAQGSTPAETSAAGPSASGDDSVPAAALAAAAAAASASAPAQAAPSPQPIVRSSEPYPPSTRTGKRPAVSSTRDTVAGPSWERMQRIDTYPAIKGGSSMRGVPRLALFAGALAIAALILFMLPAIIGIGGGGGSASASPSGSRPAATKSAAPSVVAAPTPVVYVIKKGDTLSKVANKFDVELEDLLAANPEIKDPNKVSLGQEIVIPTPPAATPQASTAPVESTAPE